MRIGLTGGAPSADKIVDQAKQAEADGFTALWYASVVTGDPLVPMAIAGRETSTIELGTAVLQTYPCHPLLQANRAASVVAAMGRAGFTLGIGPSHEPLIRDVYGMSYDHPGRSTEEYVRILTGLLRGETVDFDGRDWRAHTAGRAVVPAHPVPVLVSALGPRLLRVAGELADGAVLWMAPARAIEQHIAPKIHAAATAAGRPAPRIVAGLPVAVHDDEPRLVPPPRRHPRCMRTWRTTGGSSTSAEPRRQRTPPSSATRHPYERNCRRSSMPARLTSGPPSSQLVPTSPPRGDGPETSCGSSW